MGEPADRVERTSGVPVESLSGGLFLERLHAPRLPATTESIDDESLQSQDPRLRDHTSGGLGLGYTAAKVLESERVRRVEVIELFGAVVGFLKEGLVPPSEERLADSRFSVREGDAYATLNQQPEERWDLVLIDIDHSPDDHLGPGNESFYTESGLARAKRHLAPGGILAVWSYAENSPFVDALRAAFSVVEIVPVRYVNDLVGEEHMDWLFLARDY